MKRERWYFRDKATGQGFSIDHPALHENFDRYVKMRNRLVPILNIDGRELIGKKQMITQNAKIPCGTSCQRAKPWTECVCECGGKNHGKELEINILD